MRETGFSDFVYAAEAFFLLHIAKLIILFAPFKKIASKIGQLNVASGEHGNGISTSTAIEQAIRRSARFTLHDSKCYDQALTAKVMLNRRGLKATIYFGLAKEPENQLSAHAWVRCGNKIVTGKAGMDRFTVIAFFGDA